MDKEETTAQPEPGTEKIEGQIEEETKVLPTLEELQKEVEGKNAEIGRKEEVIVTLTRERDTARSTQKRNVSKEEVVALRKEVVKMQEKNAMMMDDIAHRVGGDYEEPKTTQKSYHQQFLDDQQAQEKAEVKPVDPDAQKFFTYCENVDLHLDYEDFEGCDPLVKEALAEKRSFREGLKYLKEKIKGQSQSDIDKLVAERTQKELPSALQQELKKLGLTATGVSAPSAPAEKTEEQSLRERYPTMK